MVTILEVARRAGVSSATVSRVLSGHPHVRPEVIERVLKAVGELEYRPSRVARSLRVQKSSIIGLVISDIMNPFFTAVVRAVEDVASQHGYAIFLCNSDENIEKEALYIDIMMAEQVAGVLITPTRELTSPCKHLVKAGIPFVAFDRRVLDYSVDTVLADNVAGAYQAVEHLIQSGHQRIAAFLAPENKTTGRERLYGYKKALETYGIAFDDQLVFTGEPRKATGRELIKEMLALPHQPSAIFCGNNLLTVGVFGYLQEMGFKIPEEYALISFDDMEWYTMTKPTISAVRQPVYEIGKLSAEILLNRIAQPDTAVREVLMDTVLIPRGSTVGE